MNEFICYHCSKPFQRAKYDQKTCSSACGGMYRRKDRKLIQCKACNNDIYVLPHMVSTKKYCNVTCRNRGTEINSPVMKKMCEQCSKEFEFKKTYYRNVVKYCSRECGIRMRNKKKKVMI